MTISHVGAYERGRMTTKKLTAQQLKGLIISIGEARKLLGADAKDLTDEDIAQQVLLLNEYAVHILKTLALQKNHYNYIDSK